MKPSLRILEQNLEALMRRAYHPVRPSEVFVRRLEQALAPYISEGLPAQQKSRSILRPVFATVLLAAAALMLLFGWGPFNRKPAQGPVLASLESILDGGDVAVRFNPAGAWRPASAAEQISGIAPREGFASVVTPTDKSMRMAGSESWAVQLASQTRLDVQPGESGLLFDLPRGSARFEGAGESRVLLAPQRVLWFAGRFHDSDGTAWGLELAQEAEPVLPSERVLAEVEKAPEIAAEKTPEEDLPASGGVIFGQVLSSLDGIEIKGFDVSLLRSVPLPQVAATLTYHFDGDEFEISDLQPGDYEVYVTAPGHAVWRTTEVPIRDGEFWEPDVMLDRGGTVRGFVVEKSTGAGLAGALVVSDVDMPAQVIGMGEQYFPKGSRAFTYTKSDGSFEFPMLSLGRHNLRASHEEFAPSWVEVHVSEERGDNLLFELSVGGSVKGRCEHPDGKPFAGAMVIVSRFPEGSSGLTMTFEQTWTNSEGRYSVENLSPGGYVVLFFSSVDPTQVYQPQYQPIVIREAAQEDASFLGENRGASVRGTVFGPDGKAIPLANMHTMNLSRGDFKWKGDTSDENGEYEIVGLDDGQYHIYAGEGNATTLGASLKLQAGDRIRRDIHLKGTDLRVRVLDDETGKPVELVEVALELRLDSDSSGAPRSERMARVFHASQDAAELKYLATGTYDLIVITESSGYAIHVVPDIWIDTNDAVQELEVRLSPACRATIDVVDSEGSPIAGVRVQAMDHRGGHWMPLYKTRTDGNGQAKFGRLFPAGMRFEVSHGLYGSRVVELTCSVQGLAQATVTLSGE